MTIFQAIRKAERLLPGQPVRACELDARWQAIIAVAEYIEHHPVEVWSFTRKWGAHANADLRAAVATCLLEHLLEHHFDRIFPLVSEACRQSVRFGDTVTRCGEFGQTSSPRNLARFRALKRALHTRSAYKAVQQTGASHLAIRRKPSLFPVLEFMTNKGSASKDMPRLHLIGRLATSNRKLFSLALPDFPSKPDSISLPPRRFVAILAADAIGVEATVLAEFSRRLIQAGCVYFCSWGTDCERVHDIFDGECLDVDPVIMTTWHAKTSLDEALWFFVSCVDPADGYRDTCRTALAISVGRPEWDEQIRRRLANLDLLARDVVDET